MRRTAKYWFVRICSSILIRRLAAVRNINHQSHIKVRAGGLNLTGVTFTRSTSYNVDVVGECGLVMTHVRTEDPLLLRTAAGYPSNPIYVGHVEGRDGTAVGTEDFIYLQSGGGATILLEKHQEHRQHLCAGRKRLQSAHPQHNVHDHCRVGGRIGSYPLEAHLTQGDTTSELARASARSTTHRQSIRGATRTALMYRNDRGRVRVSSLQGTAASADCLNFGGHFK